MSNTLNVVSKLQIKLPGYSAHVQKESAYFLKHVKKAYASWLNNYKATTLPALKTSDLDYSLEVVHEFLLATSNDTWKDTLEKEICIQIELMEKIGSLYQHYKKIKSNHIRHGAVEYIFQPTFKIPNALDDQSICMLDEDLSNTTNFCFELALTIDSGPLAEHQMPIILYMVNNNDSEYIDAVYSPMPALLAYDSHRISLENTNLNKMATTVVPNICEGVSIIFDVLNRLSPHAPLLSLVSADDEDAAIKQVKTVLLMTQNVAVSNHIDEMPVFE